MRFSVTQVDAEAAVKYLVNPIYKADRYIQTLESSNTRYARWQFAPDMDAAEIERREAESRKVAEAIRDGTRERPVLFLVALSVLLQVSERSGRRGVLSECV